ncbi:MAG: dihydrofolate reductase [Chrysiogenetes bacterium]|nr:dihydrofolate reductase [Chrysiogenetes bacterium]
MARRIGMIVAISPEGVIGVDGKIPWHYSGDFKRFKALTMGGTLIMGRNTWASIGRPLPGRRNVVVTSHPEQVKHPDVECFADLDAAVASCENDGCEGGIWLIGGAGIYHAGMEIADFIDVTYAPDHIKVEGAVRFPEIDETIWERGELHSIEGEPALKQATFTRRKNT